MNNNQPAIPIDYSYVITLYLLEAGGGATTAKKNILTLFAVNKYNLNTKYVILSS